MPLGSRTLLTSLSVRTIRAAAPSIGNPNPAHSLSYIAAMENTAAPAIVCGRLRVILHAIACALSAWALNTVDSLLTFLPIAVRPKAAHCASFLDRASLDKVPGRPEAARRSLR